MKVISPLPVPPGLLDKFLDRPSKEHYVLSDVEHELLDESRAQVIITSLETTRLWGSEESALLRDTAARLESLLAVCADLSRKLDSLRAELHDRRTVPIESLGEGLTLTRPISVVLEQSEGVVTATFYHCEIFGEGATEFDALDDLKQSMIEYYAQLRESSGNLGPLPSKHLRILSELIREK